MKGELGRCKAQPYVYVKVDLVTSSYKDGVDRHNRRIGRKISATVGRDREEYSESVV